MDKHTDCKWIEVFMNFHNDRVDKCLCHLTPESKRIHMEKDCANCQHYEQKTEDDE